MCVSWDLSRTYPLSLSDNWAPFPALGFLAVQVTWYGHRGPSACQAEPWRRSRRPVHDLCLRTELRRWADLSPTPMAFPQGFVVLLLLAFSQQESSEYCCLFEDFNMPRTKHGPRAMQEDLPSKRGGRPTTRRPSGSGEKVAPVVNPEDPVLRETLSLPPRSRNPTANVAMMATHMPIGVATSSLKSIGGPGLRNPPRRFKPATTRWILWSRGHKRMDWVCLLT